MKAIIICLAAGLSSYGFTGTEKCATTESSIYGVWKGAYGFKEQIEDIVVKFEPGNKLEFYGGGSDAEKLSGTYTLQGDTAIVFNYVVNDRHVSVEMKGNLNKTKNFVDGTWQSDKDEKGNFFLQKQNPASAEEQLKRFRYYTK